MSRSPRRPPLRSAPTSRANSRQNNSPETDSLQIEQLESRQMLSNTMLTDAQLVDTALNYLRTHAADYGLVPQDLNELVVTDQYTTKHLDVSHIYFRQRHQGLEIRDANININLRRNGDFVSAGNRFLGGIWDDNDSAIPSLSAAETLEAAVSHYGWTSQKTPVVISSATDATRAGRFTSGDLAVQDISYQLQYVGVDGQLELGWTFEIRRPLGEAWYHSTFSAEDGRLLAESNWIDHAIYNVLDRPLDSPLYGTQTLVVDPNDRIVSPYGWHDLNGIPGVDTHDTSGNNVFAQLDRFATDEGNGYRAQGGVNLEFFGNYNYGASPISSADAVTTNLFYWNNLLHDIHYQYGFDEASGNFQFNNYGNGGLGNDAVRADAQYGARLGLRDNAFFATPPDGQNPQMAMMEWTFTLPRRDSSFENTIMIHEYGHGVSNRLTGGPSNADALNDLQSSAMGEGWSDFYALMINQTADDRAGDAYPMGNWVIGDDFLFTPGLRRVYYSFDMDIDPHTFATYNISQEEHDAGEIWASVLWDLNWYLINGKKSSPGSPGFTGYGFDPDIYNGTGGNNIALQLVMDGMKLQPSNPSFLEARNAILLADQLNYGGANQWAIWTAFARRGMGYSAQDGGSRSRTVVEAFDMPEVSNALLQFGKSTYNVGSNVTVQLFDVDLVSTGSVNLKIESNGGDYEQITLIEKNPGSFSGVIDTSNVPIYFKNGVLQVRGGDTIKVTYNDLDDGTGHPGVLTALAAVNGGGGFVSSVTYAATDVPLAIGGNATVKSTIAVTDGFSVGDVNVTVNIDQPNTNSLTLTLIGPNDKRVKLATRVGNGQDFTGTTFDDDNVNGNPPPPIGTGANPFTGVFRPEELLATYDGIAAGGDWTLEIANNSVAAGTLTGWTITIGNGNAGPLRFDFGWPKGIQPVAFGFTAATNAPFDAGAGYGWLPGPYRVTPLMRAEGSALSQDFVYTRAGNFGVNVPNGVFDVTMYVGDTLVARDQMGLYLEGSFKESVTTAAGEIATRVFRVAVNDGQLTVGLKGLGAANTFVSLVGLEIEEVSDRKFDFGTSGSPVQNGYVGVNTALYSTARGYGYLGDTSALAAVDRGIGSNLTRDLHLLKAGTFEVRLPTDRYNVTITFGDPIAARDLMGVTIEGTYRGYVNTAAGSTQKVNYSAQVKDGKLTIFFQDLGGADQYVAVVALEINKANDSAAAATSSATSGLIAGATGTGNSAGSNATAGTVSVAAALPSPTPVRNVAERTSAVATPVASSGIDFAYYNSPLAIQNAEKHESGIPALLTTKALWRTRPE